jgi:hypothetical protein
MTIQRKVAKKTKQVGKYYFKRDAEIVTTNDPGVLFGHFEPRSLDQQIVSAVELAGGILRTANLPDAPVWSVKDPETGEVIGTIPLHRYVIDECGYDSGSLPGLASIIISMAEQIRTDPSDLLLFDFGRHVERLHVVQGRDKVTVSTNQKKVEWIPPAITLYWELVEGGKIKHEGKKSEAAITLKRHYEIRHGRPERSLRTYANLIREIRTSKKA